MKVLMVSKWVILSFVLVALITTFVLIFSSSDNGNNQEQKQIEIILPKG